jgi:hypothetical protein
LEHRHDEEAFDYGRDRGTILPAFSCKCTERLGDGAMGALAGPWCAFQCQCSDLSRKRGCEPDYTMRIEFKFLAAMKF